MMGTGWSPRLSLRPIRFRYQPASIVIEPLSTAASLLRGWVVDACLVDNDGHHDQVGCAGGGLCPRSPDAILVAAMPIFGA